MQKFYESVGHTMLLDSMMEEWEGTWPNIVGDAYGVRCSFFYHPGDLLGISI